MTPSIHRKPGEYASGKQPTWCPGCGDHAVWTALREALALLNLPPEQVVIVYGIGCSGNMANAVRTYGFHALHGRALPVAEAVKLANHNLTVIVVAGDGDGLGEGLNHFIHALRGNHDLTYLILDNQVYGLTTGQTSPTSSRGYKSKSTPAGVIEEPINPLALALAAGGTFVARGFSGELPHLTNLVVEGIRHKGFSFIDIFQPCVTFNTLNRYEWFYERVKPLDPKIHRADDFDEAMTLARSSDKLPVGVFYQTDRPMFHEQILPTTAEPRVNDEVVVRPVDNLIAEFR